MHPNYGNTGSVFGRNGAEAFEMLPNNYSTEDFQVSGHESAYGRYAWSDSQHATFAERSRDDEVMIMPMSRNERGGGRGVSVIVDNHMYNASSSSSSPVFTTTVSPHSSMVGSMAGGCQSMTNGDVYVVSDESPTEVSPPATEFTASGTLSSANYYPSSSSTGCGDDRPGGGNVSAGSSSNITTGYLCPICGDVSSGHHYGIDCCESCKGFFRRVVQQKQSYQCKYSGNCEVTKETRRNCAACRYERCIQLGMLTTSVRENRKRGGCKRRKIDHGRNLDASKLTQKQLRNLPTGATKGQQSATYQESSRSNSLLVSPTVESNNIMSRGPISQNANSVHDLSILNRTCLDAYIRFLSPNKITPACETTKFLIASQEGQLQQPHNSFMTSQGLMVTTFNNLPYTDCNVMWAEIVMESCFPMITESARLACLLHNWSPLCMFDYLIVKSYELSMQCAQTSTNTASFTSSQTTPLEVPPSFPSNAMVTRTLQRNECDLRDPGSGSVFVSPFVVHKLMRFNQLPANGLKFCNLVSQLESAELESNSRSSSPLFQEVSALSVIAERLARLRLNVVEVSLCRVLILLSTCMNTDASENPSDLIDISDCHLMAMNEFEKYCDQRKKSLSSSTLYEQNNSTPFANLGADDTSGNVFVSPCDQNPYPMTERPYLRNSTGISDLGASYSSIAANNSQNSFFFHNPNQAASYSNPNISTTQQTLPVNSNPTHIQANFNLPLNSTAGPVGTLQTAGSPSKFPQFGIFDNFITPEKINIQEPALQATPPEERFNEICLLLFDIERFVADNLGSADSNDVFSLLISTSSKPEFIKETYRRILSESRIV